MVVCLQRGANNLHMVQLIPLHIITSCFIKTQNGTGLPRLFSKKAIKWMPVSTVCLAELYTSHLTQIWITFFPANHWGWYWKNQTRHVKASRASINLKILEQKVTTETKTRVFAQNRPDKFPSYPPDNHHCSNRVYLRAGGTAERESWAIS